MSKVKPTLEEIKKRRGGKGQVVKKDNLPNNQSNTANDNNNLTNNTNNSTPMAEENDIPITETQPYVEESDFQDATVVEDNSDLRAFLKKPNKAKSGKSNNNSSLDQRGIDDETLRLIEQEESNGGLGDIPEDDYNPLRDAVKERGYTSGMNSLREVVSPQNPPVQERVIPEPTYSTNGTAQKPDVDETLINPTNSENGGGNGGGNANGGNGNGGNKNGNGGGNNNGNDNSDKEKREREKKEKEENLKELTKAEKKDSVAKTTDAMLLAYKTYIPLPFIHFSSYNLKKLDKLDKDDIIDLDTQVTSDGTKFREYSKNFNSQVEKAFIVTDEEVEALREPLFDVLMEQDFAFTPTQRLMFVAGQFVVAKVMMCVKFLREKKSDMDDMKRIHAENLAEAQRQFDILMKKDSGNPQQQQAPRNESPNVTVKQEVKSEKVDEKKSEPSDETKIESSKSNMNVSDAEIISETKIIKLETPTLDDVLNGESTTDDIATIEDDNDIPE